MYNKHSRYQGAHHKRRFIIQKHREEGVLSRSSSLHPLPHSSLSLVQERLDSLGVAREEALVHADRLHHLQDNYEIRFFSLPKTYRDVLKWLETYFTMVFPCVFGFFTTKKVGKAVSH